MNAELRFRPFLALTRREIKRFLKVIVQTIVAPLINSSLYLLIFGVSLGRNIDLQSGQNYLVFLLPGLIMMGCLNNSFANTSSSIVGSKFAGELEDYKVVTLNPWQILLALSTGGVMRGLMVAFLTLLVGEGFIYYEVGNFVMPENPFTLLYFLFVGGLCFASLGVSVAFWAKNFDQMSAVGSFLILPLIYLGGVFYSIDTLPPFWRSVSEFNPILYFINGVRYGFIGESDVPILTATILSLVMLSIFFSISFFVLKKSNFKRW